MASPARRSRILRRAGQVGKLGGFMPSKKQPLPGEKMLWQGITELIAIKKGFLAAKQKYGTR